MQSFLHPALCRKSSQPQNKSALRTLPRPVSLASAAFVPRAEHGRFGGMIPLRAGGAILSVKELGGCCRGLNLKYSNCKVKLIIDFLFNNNKQSLLYLETRKCQ